MTNGAINGTTGSMRLRSYDRSKPVKATFKLTEPTSPTFASNSRLRTNHPKSENVEEYESIAEKANKVWNGPNSRFIHAPKGSKPELCFNGPKLHYGAQISSICNFSECAKLKLKASKKVKPDKWQK